MRLLRPLSGVKRRFGITPTAASDLSQAARGMLYRFEIQPKPQVICVARLVRQSAAAEAIFLPGSACEITVAPLKALEALAVQRASSIQRHEAIELIVIPAERIGNLPNCRAALGSAGRDWPVPVGQLRGHGTQAMSQISWRIGRATNLRRPQAA